MKHLPFNSTYKPDFFVVEERQGNRRLYPHTEQLTRIARAVQMEFRNWLPSRLARLDKRGSGFNKVTLYRAALGFSELLNYARSDEIRLLPLVDGDLVTHVSLVQQTTEHTERGACFQFRFFVSSGFFAEIFLSGAKIIFTKHAFDQFLDRSTVENRLRERLATGQH